MIENKAKCFCPWLYFGQNCSKTGIIDSSIGLRGDGYLEFATPSPKFLTVLFSTEEENSLLLIQGTDKNFWMVSILNGELKLSVNNYGNYYGINCDIKINDGQLHTLTIMKMSNKISMQIDKNEEIQQVFSEE